MRQKLLGGWLTAPQGLQLIHNLGPKIRIGDVDGSVAALKLSTTQL
jgi:hypothetical protein